MAEKRETPTLQPIDSPKPLSTETAVDQTILAIKADLERANKLIRQGTEIVRYVEQHTSRWLDQTPGLLKAKINELELVISVLTEEGKKVETRLTGRTPPAVEVITAPKAVNE